MSQEQTETKWVCPYCGNDLSHFPDPAVTACCGEVGHAVQEDLTE